MEPRVRNRDNRAQARHRGQRGDNAVANSINPLDWYMEGLVENAKYTEVRVQREKWCWWLSHACILPALYIWPHPRDSSVRCYDSSILINILRKPRSRVSSIPVDLNFHHFINNGKLITGKRKYSCLLMLTRTVIPSYVCITLIFDSWWRPFEAITHPSSTAFTPIMYTT